MRPKFQKRSALKFDGRSKTPIMKAQRIRIGKSNYPAAGKGIIPAACGGVVHFCLNYSR